MDQQEYNNVLKLVIDNLEGGYFHPLMLKDGRVKDPKGLYSAGPGRVASGETMYGIDRANGGSINTSPAGKKFWAIIDNAGAKNKWKWNYDGGSLAADLKPLAAQVMAPLYTSFSNKFLSDTARPLVNSDKRLVFHFGYATWNGAGFFKKFANDINKAVAAGVTDLDKLASIASASRTQSTNQLIKMSSGKIAGIMQSMKGFAGQAATASVDLVKKNPIKTAAIVTLIVVGLYIGYKKLIVKK